MRRRNATFELIAATVAVMAALVGVCAWVTLRWQRHWLLEEARRGLLLTSDTLEASLRDAMMRNRRDEIQAAVARVTGQTRVREVRLAAHRDGANTAPGCVLCHGPGQKRPPAPADSRTRTLVDATSLRAFTPILAAPGCVNQACHLADARSGVLGLMDISIPLDGIDRDLAQSRRWMIALSGATIAAGALVMWMVLARRVRRPLRELLTGIQSVAGGDLTHRVATPARDEFGELAGAFNSMTDRLARAQQNLIQSERLISMGKLAAGVAHEINNPLTGILAYAEDLLEDAAPTDPRRADYQVIVNETLRCRRIVRSLLDFARQDPPRPALVAPADLVDGALGVVARQAAFQNIRLVRRIRPGLPLIEADRVQVEQVLLNLVLNAQQAMPAGGTITIAVRTARAGRQVRFLVVDHGEGIPPEVRPRIFEPFFSTKGGKTDGLGLAVSLGIVEQHRGTIDFVSRPGKGTIACVTLPVSQRGPTAGEAEA